MRPLSLLVVATKSPWPPLDGGRLLLANTLQGLAAAGHRLTLVAPVDPSRFDPAEVAAALRAWCAPRLVEAVPRGWISAFARSRREGTPLSVARHALAAVRSEALAALAAGSFDAIHVEQLQALPPQPFAQGPPLVLRAQNVESDLWGAAARLGGGRGGWRGALLAAEARRLAAWEGQAVRRASATVALTAADAGRLAELAGGGAPPVHVVAAPFPPTLPAGTAALFGDPPVVLLGSAGWLPNEDSAAWFESQVWPAVRRRLPGAVLHLFGMGVDNGGARGGSAVGIVRHPAPASSALAFAPRSILAVPLRIASGVRMKILEAWARGVPVVATPEAVSGLAAEHGRELLLAQDPGEFAESLARLHGEPDLVRSLQAAGRAALHRRHDPARVTAELAAVYAAVLR
ncbi:MAG TPA: glycosyltransferase [Thermoanaerobaculia bacterium]|nr:glycosyltransferase [Thermoanaerobaculia bacterium]